MKKLVPIIILLNSILSFGGIQSVDGPSNVCPGKEAKFTTTYAFVNAIASPFPREVVAQVKWEFIQNGSVIKTLESTVFSKTTYLNLGIFGEAEIIINQVNSNGTIKNAVNLTAGELTVRVKVLTIYVTMYFSTPIEYKKSKSFTAGISLPSTISGPNNICPGDSATFSVQAVSGLTYTWQVPATWKVNGINGPIVTGQGSSVVITVPDCFVPVARTGEASSIMPCTFPYSTFVKVKSVSPSCESGYRSKQVSQDYPFSARNTESNGVVTFSVTPMNFPSYTWTFPDYWLDHSVSGPSVDIEHYQLAGWANVTVETPCHKTFTTNSYFEPTDSGCPEPQVYPNPASTTMVIELPPCNYALTSMAVEENGVFHPTKTTFSEGRNTLDVSGLKPGLHLLKTTTADGKTNFIRFMKLK